MIEILVGFIAIVISLMIVIILYEHEVIMYSILFILFCYMVGDYLLEVIF